MCVCVCVRVCVLFQVHNSPYLTFLYFTIAFGAQLFIQTKSGRGWGPEHLISLKELKGVVLMSLSVCSRHHHSF